MALVSPRSGFLKLFQNQKIKDEQLELMVRTLEAACRSLNAPHSLSSLLQAVNDSGFIKGPLIDYMTMKMMGGSVSSIQSEFLINVIEITKALMHHLPSHSSGNVTSLLSQLNSWVVRNPGASEVAVVKECLAVAEETRQSIVKAIRGGDLVRDQDVGDAVDEEPPDDFRKIPVMPTAAEIKSDEPPFLRKNIIFGAYKTVDHYLDVQYRLLREDFVCPLREGLKMLLMSKEKNIPLRKISDIRFYSRVQILTPYCTHKGIMYRAKFDVTQFRRIRWESSKRLIFGALVGLSKDNFENIVFGTVADRQASELCKGIVDLFFEDESAYKLDPNPYTEYQMVECSAYFEAYRHVLQGLQEMQENGLPFRRYLLNQGSEVKAVDPPRYLRGQDAKYDFSCLLGDPIKDMYYFTFSRSHRNVRILDLKEWPSSEDLGLDKSQYHALQTAMTKEFVTIQGPPGTGKTFIGLKIVQLFLKNKDSWLGLRGNHSPILIVCYTNHALDQFLEGILSLCELNPGDLVRVGGRSSSENKELQKCSLFEVKRGDRAVISHDVQNGIREVRQQLEMLEAQITQAAAQIESARKFLTHEMFLQRFMSHQQAGSLLRMSRPDIPSLLPIWLGFGPGMFLGDDEMEATQEENQDDADVVEDDQEEVKRMQDERMMDETLTSTRKQHLKQIKEMSERCPGIVDISGFGGEGGEWENATNSKQRKKKKQLVRQNLGFHNIMTEVETGRVNDVWRLNARDRWRLYNFWVSKYCEELALNVRHKNVEFNRLSSHLAELNMEEDFAFLRKAAVIGMTTTGAAKYRQLLQRVHPKIVIVEEAAEVMEAHVVTTLSQRCEHLIMIGDHKQLRPNPTVYKLAKQFHLDISLFERMVKNEIHCDQLTIQHRMRPEIVKLIVPHIYKQLLNHESVLRYDNVKGIQGSVFFVNHTHEESSVDDTRSRSNLHEAQFIACLAKYLLQQGYQQHQITVLTTYTGQMFLLRKMMPKEAFGCMRITPVDNYQGEENDIILLSLVRSNEEGKIGFLQTQNRVCVALSRAKKGLYVVGNIEMMAEAGVLWNAIMKDLKKDSRLVDALPLACQNHPDSIIQAKLPEDFSKAPEGGCMLDCGYRLNCGHVCPLKCHPTDPEHKEYLCKKPCLKKLCDLGHNCPKLCHESCPIRCSVLVQKTIPACQHKQMVKCYMPESEFICQEPCQKTLLCGHPCQERCGSECSLKCWVIVPARAWPCGHFLKVECYRNPDNFPCNVTVEKRLPCGHKATMECSADVSSHHCTEEVEVSLCADLDHTTKIPCHMRTDYLTKKCEKTVRVTCRHQKNHAFMQKCFEQDATKCPFKCEAPLECGHVCPGNCGVCNNSTDGRHQPCRAPCSKKLMCSHDCKGTCGQPCLPCGVECNLFCGHRKCCQVCSNTCVPCDMPCKWTCEHHSCDLLCREPCTRPPCDNRCSVRLMCGHGCIGLCGELCPPLCAVCNRPNLQQISEFLKVENTKKTRFILLQPCGHMVEVNYMDKWVEDSKPRRPCEATCVSCPMCKSMVGYCPRYNGQIKTYMVEINRIKEVSQKTQRFSLQSNGAIATLWPTNSAQIRRTLLERVEPGDKEAGLFQRMSLGAMCVWQECQNVVQLCMRKKASVEEEVATLEDVKLKLIKSVEKENAKEIARCILVCKQLYLLLHAKRLLTFIQNPRLVEQLRSTCASLRRIDLESQTTTKSKMVFLKHYNQTLTVSFSLKQRENVGDFLQHLDEFFRASVRSELGIKKWMICTRGQ